VKPAATAYASDMFPPGSRKVTVFVSLSSTNPPPGAEALSGKPGVGLITPTVPTVEPESKLVPETHKLFAEQN
jgi:hypothetical protein